MDILHNQQASDEHYQRLRRLLADEEEVRDKLLWIYQCQSRGKSWHRRGDLDTLRRAVERSRFVGIGGLVSVLERDLSEAQDILGALGEVLDQADAQAHVFGLGNFALLLFAQTQRWFRSADSARWLQGLSSRTLLTTDGKVISARTLTFTGMQCAEQNVAAMQAWLQPDKARQLFLFPDPDEDDSLTNRSLHCPPTMRCAVCTPYMLS
jgi:hypothetical protein